MLDADGVLVNGRPADGLHWATGLEEDLGLNFEVLQHSFFNPYWDAIVTGCDDLRERLAAVLPVIAPALTVDKLLTYWFRQDARLDRELLSDLPALRNAGLRIYLATNQEHQRARYLMNTLGLAAHLDGCCYSAAIGHRKPTIGFFEFVVGKTGFRPSELLLIDDAEENVRAALQLGWHAAHWTGCERLNDLIARVIPDWGLSAGC